MRAFRRKYSTGKTFKLKRFGGVAMVRCFESMTKWLDIEFTEVWWNAIKPDTGKITGVKAVISIIVRHLINLLLRKKFSY